MKRLKICMHIGHAEIDDFWVKLKEYLLLNYEIDICFIADGKIIAEYLNENNIECYYFDDKSVEVDKQLILSSLNNINTDLNELFFTEFKFKGENQKKKLEEKVFLWLAKAYKISNQLKDVDVFIDFAGDELGHNVFDVTSKFSNKRIIKYRESLFPKRLVFLENKFYVWEIDNNVFVPNWNEIDNETRNYIDRYISSYFHEKKVFWGDPKSRDYKLNIDVNKIAKNIFRINRYQLYSNKINRWINKYRVKLLYDKLESIDINKNIFYFPLHYPLDSQLTFRGRPFLNQIDLVFSILNFLPYNSQLIIKEHPHARGAIPFSQLKKLKRDDRIVLVDSWLNTHKILPMVDHVLIINSTVGLEALYYGKHVISLGKNYINNHKSVSRLTGFYDLFKLYKYNKQYTIKNNQEFKDFLMKAYIQSYACSSMKILSRDESVIPGFSKAIYDYINLKNE